jgi:hypothetical protein
MRFASVQTNGSTRAPTESGRTGALSKPLRALAAQHATQQHARDQDGEHGDEQFDPVGGGEERLVAFEQHSPSRATVSTARQES